MPRQGDVLRFCLVHGIVYFESDGTWHVNVQGLATALVVNACGRPPQSLDWVSKGVVAVVRLGAKTRCTIRIAVLLRQPSLAISLAASTQLFFLF